MATSTGGKGSGLILVPPAYGGSLVGPLVFLAGPIQGASDWQSDAIRIMQEHVPHLNIANPRRNVKFEKEFKEKMYNEQVDWETYHLRRAGQNGVVLFWLAKEAEHDCGRAYAQTTRFELAEWKVRHERDGVKLALGIEEGFTGARYIRRRFPQDCPDMQIHKDLESTVLDAIAKAYLK